MGGEATDSFVGWLRARLATSSTAKEQPGAGEQARRRHSSTPACDICGRTILAGETPSRFRREDRELLVCTLCEGRLLTQGYVRAA